MRPLTVCRLVMARRGMLEGRLKMVFIVAPRIALIPALIANNQAVYWTLVPINCDLPKNFQWLLGSKLWRTVAPEMHQASFGRHVHCLRRVRDPQLLQDVCHVRLYGFSTDIEEDGNFLVALSGGDCLQYSNSRRVNSG